MGAIVWETILEKRNHIETTSDFIDHINTVFEGWRCGSSGRVSA
jgi:hypothetical protein